MLDPGTQLRDNIDLVLTELREVLQAVDASQVAAAEEALLAAGSVFFTGAGRSGLAARMAAMRFMHFGLRVHVVGEVTAPAIAQGDLLVIASGSGTTSGAVHAAEVAHKADAKVALLTTAINSPLATMADLMILIPAAAKQDRAGTASRQYAGSLFEQSVLLLMDSMFQNLWRTRGQTAEELWKRHANLE